MGETCQIFSALILTQLWVTKITFMLGQSGHQIRTKNPDAEYISVIVVDMYPMFGYF